MQQLLAEMKPKLEEAARATARMIEKITVDTVSIVADKVIDFERTNFARKI